ncbi:MAG: class I SAM-dependent methyltransferase [Akkermansiaceae bacterium]|nr:class I SAM-dependent methyltransferase [Akkermansiaceae bacterium]
MNAADESAHQAERIRRAGARPHFAPEEAVLAVHRDHLRELAAALGRPPAVLVLGATPELADLGLEAGCPVIQADRSAEVLAAAEVRRRVADRSNERVLCSDWSRLEGVPDGSIDFVMGDAALNNVPAAAQPAVFAELRRVMRGGGVCSLKQIVTPDPIPARYEMANALAAYRHGDLSASEFYIIVRFASFHAELFEPDGSLLDGRRVFEAIDDMMRAGTLTREEFAFLDSRRGRTRHTIFTAAAQRDLLQSELGECAIVPVPGGCHYEDILNLFRVAVAP